MPLPRYTPNTDGIDSRRGATTILIGSSWRSNKFETSGYNNIETYQPW